MIRHIRARFACAVWLVFLLPAAALAQETLKPWYGLMHAHTYFCDGSGTPAAAYARAKSKKLDFFAITAHNHAEAEDGAKERIDGILIANTPALYASDSLVEIEREGKKLRVKSMRQAARDATTASFVALYGQEFSSISKGNHLNVLGVDTVLTAPNGEFRTLYESLPAAALVQFNHPEMHQDLFYGGRSKKTKAKMFNDYGFDDYGEDFAKLVAAVKPFARLIEVLSGPAMEKTRKVSHKYHNNEDDYYYYLSQGFHLSPSAGHDNHYETWGDTTDARMGIWAASLSEDQVNTAFRENRTFATEDKDLRLSLHINGQPMGSVLSLAEDSPLTIKVAVADPTQKKAKYSIELIHGFVQAQKRASLSELHAEDGLEDDPLEDVSEGTHEFTGYVASGRPEFFYVRVRQDDEDRAWSSPVWINHPR